MKIFQWQEAYAKFFEYCGGELCLNMNQILHGLDFVPTSYAPRLHRVGDKFVYNHVREYNYKWLKKDKKGNPKSKSAYVPFEPASVWSEERWTLVRRVVGDELCQKAFFLCARGFGFKLT